VVLTDFVVATEYVTVFEAANKLVASRAAVKRVKNFFMIE